VDENLELRSDTETQRALQVRQGLGRAFAWLYVVERVLPVLESLYKFYISSFVNCYCDYQYSFDFISLRNQYLRAFTIVFVICW